MWNIVPSLSIQRGGRAGEWVSKWAPFPTVYVPVAQYLSTSYRASSPDLITGATNQLPWQFELLVPLALWLMGSVKVNELSSSRCCMTSHDSNPVDQGHFAVASGLHIQILWTSWSGPEHSTAWRLLCRDHTWVQADMVASISST